MDGCAGTWPPGITGPVAGTTGLPGITGSQPGLTGWGGTGDSGGDFGDFEVAKLVLELGYRFGVL